ncbi:4289_t:CDS:1 [Ambispora leptoticha]|uniref:4289_t:CDS:1 n=1 Tax=Ambispora leptoticha TaxID=144679 RepID=A0A9N8ZMA8_9GLOM|nr:4289_t:CDS:1 [Ambispora leptoticha]
MTMSLPRIRDYNKYFNFAITLNSTNDNNDELINKISHIKGMEYLGRIGELTNVVEVRILKEDEEKGETQQRIEMVKSELEALNEVQNVELLVPKIRNKKY